MELSIQWLAMVETEWHDKEEKEREAFGRNPHPLFQL